MIASISIYPCVDFHLARQGVEHSVPATGGTVWRFHLGGVEKQG